MLSALKQEVKEEDVSGGTDEEEERESMSGGDDNSLEGDKLSKRELKRRANMPK